MTGSEPPAPRQDSDSAESGERGLYLYGIGRSADPAADLTTPESELTIIRINAGKLSAFVREVSLGEFSEEVLESRLQDHQWLIQSALEHQNVVAQLHRTVPVLPATFGSVYPSEEALRHALSESPEPVLKRLDMIAGCDEWALHVFGRQDELREKALSGDPELRQLRSELENSSAGRAYMIRQRIQTRLSQAAEAQEDELVRAIFEGLRDHVVQYHAEAPRSDVSTSEGESEVSRAALLVGRANNDKFLAIIDTLSIELSGIRIEVTGPWPVYSFAKVESED